MEVKDLLETKAEVPRKIKKITYFLLLFLIIFFIIDYTFQIPWITIDFDTILISIFASFIASVSITYFVPLGDNLRIQKITKLTEKSFLMKLLEDLKKFDNKYCSNWQVEIKVNKPYKKDYVDTFYKVNIDYSYKKNITNTKIEMIFYRLKSDEDLENMPRHIDLANRYEFYWVLDERQFPKKLQDEDFEIRNLLVSGKEIPFVRKISGNEIIYEASLVDLENFLNIGNQIDISYEATLLYEREDCLTINLDIPTKNVKLTFDTSEIKDEVVTYAYESASFVDKPLKTQNDNIWRIVNHDWLMPKNCFVFVWWKK